MASTVQKEREEVYAVLPHAASFQSLAEEWNDCVELLPKRKETFFFVNKNGEAKKHRTEWCATANKNRCTRCGRCSKIHEDAREM